MEFFELYLSNLSLPMVYRVKSKMFLVMILIMMVFSILFNLGIGKYINNNLIYLFVYSVILNILFLKFNFMIRIYNVFFRSIGYFL